MRNCNFSFSSSHRFNSKLSENIKHIHGTNIIYNIVDTIPIGIIILDANFNIVIWNSTQEKISGISRKDIINKNFFKAFSYLLNDNIKYKIKNILKTKESIIINDFLIEHMFFYKYFNIKVNPVKYESNRKSGIMLSIEDCTNSNSHNNNLKCVKGNEENLHYYKLINLIPSAIFFHVDGNVTFANTSMCNLIGIDSSEKIIGKSCLSFISTKYHDIVKQRILEVKNKGKSIPTIEQKFLAVNGNEIPVKVTSALCPCKGFITPAIVVVQPIEQDKNTEFLIKKVREDKKSLEEMYKLDKLRMEFFYNICHELKTPLNIILSALQLLTPFNNMKIDSEKNSKYLNSIKQNCFRLLKLINNLIDSNKIDSGYFEVHLSNYNIVNVIEDITLSVAQYIKNKSINLIFDTDIEEKFIACDPDKIERIMLNLISNSIKFTDPGGSIFVNIFDKKDYIIVSVKDTGIGIHKHDLNLIFDRFHQGSESLSKNSYGSGIGLSLVKSLVEMHGGEISVKSIYGKGTEFIIKLPAIKVKNINKPLQMNDFKQNYVEKINVEFSDIYSQ